MDSNKIPPISSNPGLLPMVLVNSGVLVSAWHLFAILIASLVLSVAFIALIIFAAHSFE